MQNTNTTYSPSDTSMENRVIAGCDVNTALPGDTIVMVPLKNFAPRIVLNKPQNLTGSLLYTVIFLIIFAFIRLQGKNLLSLLLNVVAHKKKYEFVLTEGITQNLIYYSLSLLLSFSILSIALTYLTLETLSLYRILYIFSFLVGWHLLFICIVRLCSWTFNARIIQEECIINIWAYHIVGGVIISPFVLAIFFVKAFAIQLMIKIIAICLILFYLVKFLRWVRILFGYKVPIFYMILYLCTLEVIPLLVLYKLLV